MRAGKRVVDVVGAVTLLLLLLPLLITICVLVWVACGRPAILTQERLGLNSKPFRMYKFRTMGPERDEFGRLLPDTQRVTPLGRFLRKTSLDELPQLLCVLKGDMSLVGPRPLLIVDLPIYSLEQAQRDQINPSTPGWTQIKRHELRPGITGWAQIKGRNAIAFEDRFELDAWYVDNCSLWVDVRILWITLFEVLKRNGTTPHGRVLTPEPIAPEPIADTIKPLAEPVVEAFQSAVQPVNETLQSVASAGAPAAGVTDLGILGENAKSSDNYFLNSGPQPREDKVRNFSAKGEAE